jgi:organic radical activating enzyme
MNTMHLNGILRKQIKEIGKYLFEEKSAHKKTLSKLNEMEDEMEETQQASEDYLNYLVAKNNAKENSMAGEILSLKNELAEARTIRCHECDKPIEALCSKCYNEQGGLFISSSNSLVSSDSSSSVATRV